MKPYKIIAKTYKIPFFGPYIKKIIQRICPHKESKTDFGFYLKKDTMDCWCDICNKSYEKPANEILKAFLIKKIRQTKNKK